MTQAAHSISFGKLVPPSGDESAAATRILKLMAANGSRVSIRIPGESDEHILLPKSILKVLMDAAREVSQGNPVAVVSAERELTTQQAADLLNVSRPYLVGLLEEEQIPYHFVGKHRRAKLSAILDYKERRDNARSEALRNLTRESQDLGLDY